MYKLMTPGPTQVPEAVRMARSRICTNPDLDLTFVDFYHETCQLISRLLGSTGETLILGGEGILGLEAACATLTEPGDHVLVLDNGLYGGGWADFVRMYGGIPELYSAEYHNTLDPAALETFLRTHHDYKYATVVHCDTPSGMLNDIAQLCPLLKQYGILTVVDSVSGMFGEAVQADASCIDVLCGGSQKAVSAPPGLSFVTLSKDAWAAMKGRKTPVASFYANLLTFAHYYEEKWFPYTMPISDLYGLRTAVDAIAADTDMLGRHARLAHACRTALTEAGLQLYQQRGFSNTVTVFCVPDGTTDTAILDAMREQHHILLAGSFGTLAGQVIRIGHMGANANEADLCETMDALGQVLQTLGVALRCNLGSCFSAHCSDASPH